MKPALSSFLEKAKIKQDLKSEFTQFYSHKLAHMSPEHGTWEQCMLSMLNASYMTCTYI